MERVHVIVHGMVQGVFFRAHTRQIAMNLGLSGCAVNRADGTVEAIAEGERKNLEEFVDWCRQGPDMARVDRVEIVWEQASGRYSGFHIS